MQNIKITKNPPFCEIPAGVQRIEGRTNNGSAYIDYTERKEPFPYIYLNYIKSQIENIGLGKMMLEHLKELADTENQAIFLLNEIPESTKKHRIYEKTGWHQLDGYRVPWMFRENLDTSEIRWETEDIREAIKTCFDIKNRF